MGVKVFGTDVAAGKIVYIKPEGVAKEEMASVKITTGQFDKLLTLAQKDGFENDADTPKGVQAVNTRQVANYVRLAVEGLIVKRADDLTEESEEGEDTKS